MTKIDWGEKTALVTGASSGIGESVSRLLAEKGIHVIGVARRLGKLKALEDSINATGGDFTPIEADLSKSARRIEVFEQLKSRGNLPDILVNNAGSAWYGYFYQMPWQVADDILSVNVKASTHLMRLFLPAMVEKRFGRVINVGSIAGKLPEQGISVYAASKSYLDTITTSIFRELRGSGVTVSVLRSGAVKTEFYDHARSLENGGSIPAEKLAISSSRVAGAAWSLIRHPRRYAYVPFYLAISPLLETLFSGVIDLVGPVLLRHKK